MIDLRALLAASSARHSHLCPRQVLGARMGLAGAAALDLAAPRRDKRLLAILETDGCFADGVEVATGCTVGRRTLRIEDYGKIAVTFVDVRTEAAIRLAPQPDVRTRALAYAPGESRHYFAQLTGYQVMPDEELFSVLPVVLNRSVAELISRPGVRTNCAACGEEIINEREVLLGGQPYCVSCARGGYFAVPIALALPPIAYARPEQAREAALETNRR